MQGRIPVVVVGPHMLAPLQPLLDVPHPALQDVPEEAGGGHVAVALVVAISAGAFKSRHHKMSSSLRRQRCLCSVFSLSSLGVKQEKFY